MGLSCGKGQEENPPSLSSLFFFISFFSLFFKNFQFLCHSFFISPLFLARQSCHHFFNQGDLWCGWNIWWGSHHPLPHLDFFVQCWGLLLSVFHHQRSSYVVDAAPVVSCIACPLVLLNLDLKWLAIKNTWRCILTWNLFMLLLKESFFKIIRVSPDSA
jgi:hypothetical protein